MKHLNLFLNSKSLMVLVALFAISLSVEAKKIKPVFKEKLEIVSFPSDRGKFIRFSGYTFDFAPYFIRGFEVENLTNERIYIEWENARLNHSRIVFGDDSRISMRYPKVDEAVSANSSSIRREITCERNIDDDDQIELYDTKDLKKKNIGKKDTIYITIPIRYLDGKVEEFRLQYTVWYEIPSE